MIKKNILLQTFSWWTFISLFLFLPSLSFSDSVSTTGDQFLQIPAGVRGPGMGGAFTAVADDTTAPYWNSAGLAQIQGGEIDLLHVSYLESIDYEFIGGAIPFG